MAREVTRFVNASHRGQPLSELSIDEVEQHELEYVAVESHSEEVGRESPSLSQEFDMSEQ